MVTGAEHIEVLRKVVETIGACGHVCTHVYVDEELDYIQEQDAPGVAAYRDELQEFLKEMSLSHMPHEQIIGKLDQSAHIFRILILKTNMMIPYTSVFIELDCGYWSAAAEQKLRRAIDAANP